MRIPANKYFAYQDGQGQKRIQDDVMLEVSRVDQTQGGIGLLSAVKKKLEESQDIVDNSPKRDEKNIKNDLYFMLGMIHMAKWILSFPGEAKRILNKEDKE